MEPSQIQWLEVPLVDALHEASLKRFGGAPGLRDRGLLESALARPQNRHAYESTSDLATLAASYAYGIVRNHPFIDGNKRTGLLVLRAFLFSNGHGFVPPEAEAVSVILALAAGDVTEAEVAAWVRAHVTAA